MSNPFGDLRSLLQRPASTPLWEELCAMLDAQVRRTDERQWQELVAYARGVLGHWQASMCLAPQRWVDAMFEGRQVPQLAVARAIDTRGRDVGDEQIFEMTLTRELAGLTELSMGFSNRVGWRPEKLDYGCVRELCTSSHLSNLRTIRLTGQHLLPDSFVSLLDRHNAFDALDTLDFSFNDLNFLKPGDFERLEAHSVAHLYLRGCNMSSQGAMALEASELLLGVTTLDLSGNSSLTHTDLIHLLRDDTRHESALKNLSITELGLDHAQLAELVNHMPHTRLERLDLKGMTRNEDISGRVLRETFSAPTFDTLRHLNMDSTDLASAEELVAAWPSRLCSLSSLSVQNTGLGYENEIDAQVRTWLVTMIESGTGHIDLSQNDIDVAWIEDVLSRIDQTRASCTLCLDFNRIDPHDEELPVLRELAAAHQVTLQIDQFVEPFTYNEEEYYEDAWEG